MRSLKLGLLVVSTFSIGLGASACSSDGASDDLGEPDAAVDASANDGGKTQGNDGSSDTGHAGHDAGIDSTTGGGHDDASVDAAIDTSASDAAVDVHLVDAQPDVAIGPVDAGAPGSPCAPLNSVQSQACGMCGTQTRVCLGTGDGGSAVWQDWGACLKEVVNGCVPGTLDSEACGMCGHRTKICQLDCVYAVGSCQGQPPNACEPGETNFVEGLSCDAGAGRTQTCDNTCAWGGYGACAAPDYGAPIAIPATAGTTVTSVRTMMASPTLAVLDYGECPATITTPGSKNAYAYVLVSNETTKTAKVSVWFSKASGGQDIRTMIAAYPANGALPPLKDAARLACISVGSGFSSVNDDCYSGNQVPTECASGWGGLVADDGEDDSITLGPNGSIWIYAGATEETSSTNPHAGPFLINVRTESLN